mgnify:FL=1
MSLHSSAALAALRSTLKSRTYPKEKYDHYEETYIFMYGWDIFNHIHFEIVNIHVVIPISKKFLSQL